MKTSLVSLFVLVQLMLGSPLLATDSVDCISMPAKKVCVGDVGRYLDEYHNGYDFRVTKLVLYESDHVAVQLTYLSNGNEWNFLERKEQFLTRFVRPIP